MNVMGAERRFFRQLSHEGFMVEMQDKLCRSTVLVAGVGGIGGETAYSLAGAGIGELRLIHQGPLEIEDLNRQSVQKESAIGSSRVATAAVRLKEYSSATKVLAYDMAVGPESIRPVLKGVDLIIDARHNFTERRILNKVAFNEGIPCLFVAMDSLEAQMILFIPGHTGCLECLYPKDPPYWDPFAFPVFGAVAHAIGAFAAMEAIKYLSGFMPPSGRLCLFDMGDYSLRKVKYKTEEGCPVCS